MNKYVARFCQATSFTLVVALSPQVSANNDQAFTNYLGELCLNPSGVLIATCTSAFPTLGGGGSETPSTTGNTGLQGAQGGSATDSTIRDDSALTEVRLQNWGLFSTLQYTDTKKDDTDLENGFNGDSQTLLIGADYRFNPRSLAGIAVSIGESNIDFDNSSGTLDTSHTEFIAFFSHQFSDVFYVDGYTSITDNANESERQVDFGDINYVAEGDFDADKDQWGLTAGYILNIKQVSIDATLTLNQSNTTIERYEETGGTTVDNLNLIYESQRVESQTVSLGVVSSLNISTSNGVLVPFLRVEAIKENQNDAREITSRLVSAASSFNLSTEAPDREFMIIGGGVKLVATKGIQCYLDTDWMVAHEYLQTWRISAGLRIEI